MVSPTRLTVEGKTEIGLCHTDHFFRFGAKIVLGVHIFPLLDISFETFVAKPMSPGLVRNKVVIATCCDHKIVEQL